MFQISIKISYVYGLSALILEDIDYPLSLFSALTEHLICTRYSFIRWHYKDE